jgi:hypothetical protein
VKNIKAHTAIFTVLWLYLTVMRSTINLQSDRESIPASSTVMRSTINLQSDRESIPASSTVMRSTINLQSDRESIPASSADNKKK